MQPKAKETRISSSLLFPSPVCVGKLWDHQPALALKSFDLKPPLNMMASPPMSSPHPKIKAKSFEVSRVVK